MEEDEKSFYCYRQDRKTEGSQWEEEKSWALEELGQRTWEKWRQRDDRRGGYLVKFGVKEFGCKDEAK